MWMGCEVAPKALSTRSVSTSYLQIYLSSWGVVTLTPPGHHLQVHSGHVVPVHPHHGLLLHSQPRCLSHSREPPQPHQVSTHYIYNISTTSTHMTTIYSIYLQHIYNIFSSAEDLLTQTQIKYGCLGGGSTFNFFKVNIFYGKNIFQLFFASLQTADRTSRCTSTWIPMKMSSQAPTKRG